MEASPREIQQQELLAQMGWVRALAGRLVADAALADDIAQDAWLAAQSARPRLEGEGALRAWLATVVRNLVGKSARGARRRRRREEVAARSEATESTADLIARGSLHREITNAVMALEDPYRSALLLRYLDGLSSAEVARRQGISPAAARKRLSRANEKLRELLDSAHGGDRRAWSMALVSLARTGPATKVAAGATAGTVLGGLSVTLKHVVGLIALSVVALISLDTWFGGGSSEAEAPAAPGEAPDVALAEPSFAGTEALPTRDPDRIPAGPDLEEASDFPAELLAGWNVTLVDDAGGPVEGADVELRLERSYGPVLIRTPLAVAGPTDERGRVFMADLPDTLPEDRRAELLAEGAQLRLVPAGLFGEVPKFGLPGDDEGSREQQFAMVADAIAEASEADLLGVAVETGENSPPVEVTLVRPDAGDARITVRATAGEIPGGFELHLTEGKGSYMTGAYLRRPLPGGVAEATVDFPGIGLGRQLVANVVNADGASLSTATFDGPRVPGERAEAAVELRSGGPRLRGRVWGLDGDPLVVGTIGKPSASSFITPGDYKVTDEIAVADDGTFDVEAPWLVYPIPIFATLRLRAGGDEARVYQRTVQVASDAAVIDLGEIQLGPLPTILAGRIVNGRGEGVVATLELSYDPDPDQPVAWGGYRAKLETDSEGRFEQRGSIPPGTVVVGLESPTHVLPGGTGTLRSFPVGAEDVQLVAWGTGWLTVDSSALPQGHLSHFTIKTWRDDLDAELAHESRDLLSLRGESRLGPVSAGPLQVRLEGWGLGVLQSWEILLLEGETVDLGTLVLDRALYTHTVILDCDTDSISDPPQIAGRIGNRTVLARAHWSGLRHTFLTTEPVESIFVHTLGAGHGDSPAQPVTGSETHLVWD